MPVYPAHLAPPRMLIDDCAAAMKAVVELLATSATGKLATEESGSWLYDRAFRLCVDCHIPDLDVSKVPSETQDAVTESVMNEAGKLIKEHMAGHKPAASMIAFATTYQRLLAHQPVITASRFELRPALGRRKLGAFYTPGPLVQHLLEHSVLPTLGEHQGDIADFHVCDPAVGVGAFLIHTAHLIASESKEASPDLDSIITNCLYGVDLDPTAAVLCRAVLAIHTSRPTQVFEHLAHKIKVGNAIVGATPDLIQEGIPSEAFVVLEDDCKRAVSYFKSRNNTERKRSTLDQPASHDANPKLAADAWCAAFVWRMHDIDQPGKIAKCPGNWDAITQNQFEAIRTDPANAPEWMIQEINRLAYEHQFFHWHLEFPEIFDAERSKMYARPLITQPSTSGRASSGGSE